MTDVDQLLTKKVADRYLKREVLGEGTYGVVYKAIDIKSGQTVAIKKIRIGKQKEGVNFTALREIKLLKELKDPNIIELIDAFPHKGNLHLVFEFMETDLEAVIRDRNIVLSPPDIKSYIQMMLKGLAICHRKWVLHRDMKPNNLLIGPGGQLKLADFGLARIYGSPDRRFTHQVFARWYRAPELLFGAKQYGPGVDVWAAACIFAELLLRRPFLQGNSDIDQLGKIFAAFGTPKPSQWPDLVYLPDYVEYQYVPGQPLRILFPMASDDTLDLLGKMFSYDPKARISAQQALEHRYFSSIPPPTEPALLPRPPPKKESVNPKVSDFNPQDGPTVLSPPRKQRRVMPHREGFDVNANDMIKMDDHGHEVRQIAEEKSGQALKSLDFSVFAAKPPNKLTSNRQIREKKKAIENMIKAASSVKDHLSKFPQFRHYRRNGLYAHMESGRGNKLAAHTKKCIQNLLKLNMEAPYGPEWPDEEKIKRREMVAIEAHYIFVHEISNEDADEVFHLMDKERTCSCKGPIVGFVHYRFILEEEVPVLYVYELQLEPHVQGKGLGKYLMQLIELIACENGMGAVVLTVQKANLLAMDFYIHKLGYTISAISPSRVDPLLQKSYEILCKTLNHEAQEVL